MLQRLSRLMATSGRDGSMRIWDLRNSFTPLASVKVGVASSLNFSQRGFLALATGNDALVIFFKVLLDFNYKIFNVLEF